MATNSPVNGSASTTVVPANKSKQTQAQKISSDILDDLASRFIINIPVQERQNLIRTCFQIELAHWFYLDFYCSIQKQKCGIKQFAYQMFQHIPFLQPHLPNMETVLEEWKQYKLTVPTCGAILISEDLKHVLLVQSFFAKSSWGFPKGKINENEEMVHCAIREVYEETGYDIKNLIVATEFIELIINYQFTRLYLVPGVPLTTVFSPKTRNEIKSCEWFPIDLLPVTRHDSIVKDNLNMNGNSFFMILPFIKRLKKWLDKYQNGTKHGNKSVGNNHASNSSPVCVGTAGKQKNFLDSNGKGGNSASAQRQRQRHKSMGDIEQQQAARAKQPNSGQNAKQQQQQQQQTPNQQYQPSPQQLAAQQNAPTVRVSSSANATYQAFLRSIVDHPSNTAKKSAKKQEPVGVMTRAQTKRKLFDNESTAEVTPAGKDPLAIFDDCKAWREFSLDYSRFL